VAKPLQGRTIVVTRPDSDGDPLAEGLRRAGATVICAPAIRLIPPRSWKPLDRALKDLGGFDALVFTSANAVDAFFDRAELLGVRPARPERLFCIGPATLKALKTQGWKAATLPGESRAEGLTKLFKDVRGWRVLIPRAARAREVLPKFLRKAGAVVVVAPAYRTVADRDGLRRLKGLAATPVDAVAFTSASTVDQTAQALGRAGMRRLFARARAASIGPITTRALGRRGVLSPIQAPQASAAALCRALIGRLGRAA
jgi:uroporphyrinogen III methyltransferase / synthase